MPFVSKEDILGELPDEWRDSALQDTERGRTPEEVWTKLQNSVEDDIAAALSPTYDLPDYEADAAAVPILRNVRSAARHLTLASLYRRRQIADEANPWAKLAADSIKHLRMLGQRDAKGPAPKSSGAGNSIKVIGEPSRLTPTLNRSPRRPRGGIALAPLLWLALCVTFVIGLATYTTRQTARLMRNIAITTSLDTRTPTALACYRAVPLRLTVTLDGKIRTSADGWQSIKAQIRNNPTDLEDPLAEVVINDPSGPGPFVLDFTSADTNRELDGAESKLFWVVIVATKDDGETIDVWHASRLAVIESGYSEVAATPSNPVGPLSKPEADLRYNRAVLVFPEHLAAWQGKLIAGGEAVTTFSGDSTSSGVNTSAGYRRHEIAGRMGRRMGLLVTGVNRGVAGAHTGEWQTTYAALDLATEPDVLVLGWGANDGYYDRTAAQFEASLRAGLAAIRGTRPVEDLAILLCTPTPMNDTPNDRGEAWFESITPLIRKAALDYQCGFLDLYHALKQATAVPGYMDDPFGDGRKIHPGDAMNLVVMDLIGQALFPAGVKASAPVGTMVAYVSPTLGSDALAEVGNPMLPYATYAAALTAARRVVILENTTVSTAYSPAANTSYHVEIPAGVTLTFASGVALVPAASDSVVVQATFAGRGNLTMAGTGLLARPNTNLTISLDVNILTIAAGRSTPGVFNAISGAKWQIKARLIDASALSTATDSLFLAYNFTAPVIVIGEGTRIRSGGVAVIQAGGPAGVSIHLGAGVLIYSTGASIYTTAGSTGGISAAGAFYNVASTLPDGGTVYGELTHAAWLTLDHVTAGIA